MREYLIRPVERADWIAVHVDDLDRVLTPNGWGAVVVAGSGEHRVRIGETDMAFSGEDVGWHVSIEGPMAQATADAVIETVTKQLAAYSGEQATWTCIQE